MRTVAFVVTMEILKNLGLLFLIVGLPTVARSQTFQCEQCYQEPGTCEEVKGYFRVTIMSEGYNPVVTIPVAACYINVTETSSSGNFLAVKDLSTQEYILNGYWITQDPGLYRGAGAVFKYGRVGDGCPGECLRATGPTTSSVTVQLLYHERNPGVHYSYRMPKDTSFLQTMVTVTDDVDDRHAGRPNQQLESRAPESRTSHGSQEPGSFPEFQPVPREPTVRRRGPIFSSEFKHAALVNRQHDENVRRHRTGHRQEAASGGHRQALSEATFSRGENDVGVRREDEDSDVDTPFVISSITEKEAQDESTDVVESSGDYINLGSSDEFAWHLDGYTECTRVCGGGVQQPSYTCRDTITGGVAEDGECANAIKPDVSYRACNDEPCTQQWQIGMWSSCSVTCGNGTQSRDVNCGQRVSATVTLDLPDIHCTSLKPEMTKPCFVSTSCNSWVTSDWSKCSVTCGQGSRDRDVTCQDTSGNTVPAGHCDDERPVAKETCDMGSCARMWYYTQWAGQCSDDCQSGVVTREVHCVTESGDVLSDEHCTSTQKPSTEKSCTRRNECKAQWFTGPWGKCSSSCGEGVKRRFIVCMQMYNNNLVTLPDGHCSAASKPEVSETCTQPPCSTTWYFTDWTQCSASCGGGTKSRTVQCLGQDMRPSTGCSHTDKPDISQPCNTEQCRTRPKNPRCGDKYPNCSVVVKARLCRYPYYQRKCCLSCSGINSNTARSYRSSFY